MKRANLLVAGLLGALVAASIGCADGGTDVGGPSGGGDSPGLAQWKIQQIGAPSISGCGVTSLFDVSAPLNIGFIAVNGQNLKAQDLSLRLFRVDVAGNRQEVQTQAQQAALLTQTEQTTAQASDASHNAATSDSQHMKQTTRDARVHVLRTTMSSSATQAGHRAQTALEQQAEASQNQAAGTGAQQNEFLTQSAIDSFASALSVDGFLAALPSFSSASNSAASDRAAQASNQSRHADNRDASAAQTNDQSTQKTASQQAALSEKLQLVHQAVADQANQANASTADSASNASQETAQSIVQALQSSNLNDEQIENTMVFNTNQLEDQHFVVQVTSNLNAGTLNVLAGAGPLLDAAATFAVAPISGCGVDP